MTMQTEPTNQRELVQALLDDPDFLDMFRGALRATQERPVFNMAGDRIDLLAAATGRRSESTRLNSSHLARSRMPSSA